MCYLHSGRILAAVKGDYFHPQALQFDYNFFT
jgi:hypothetical protein